MVGIITSTDLIGHKKKLKMLFDISFATYGPSPPSLPDIRAIHDKPSIPRMDSPQGDHPRYS
jgi:hypothetical protein